MRRYRIVLIPKTQLSEDSDWKRHEMEAKPGAVEGKTSAEKEEILTERRQI